MAESFAPAKINLTLHVTGQRQDGYHLLDSLVVFANVGDSIVVRDAARLSLSVTGPCAAGVPSDETNLVMKSARLLGAAGADIALEKRLPVASGIGGGSADAAAALRALAELWGRDLPKASELLSLGADVPVCLTRQPARMSGIGEVLVEGPMMPDFWLVLVNPGVAVSTPEIFRALASKNNAPMPDILPEFGTAADFASWLATQRNDLQPPAETLQPAISTVLAALTETSECLISRMSGSGATCFGIFANEASARAAAAHIQAGHPNWWVVAAGRFS